MTKRRQRSAWKWPTCPPPNIRTKCAPTVTVLDLTTLTTLNTNYITAVSQLNSARARLAASIPAFARAQALYAKNFGNLVQVQATEAVLIADRASCRRGAIAGANTACDGHAGVGPRHRQCHGCRWRPHHAAYRARRIPVADYPAARRECRRHSRRRPRSRSAATPGRAEVRYISPATRADPRIQGISYFYAAAANTGVLPGMNVRAFLANGPPVEG